jgi:hypothetical protein
MSAYFVTNPEKMEAVFVANRAEMGVWGRKFIEENFALDKVWSERWLPFLDRLEAELYPQKPVVDTAKKTA